MKKWLIKKFVNGACEQVNLGNIKYEEALKLAKDNLINIKKQNVNCSCSAYLIEEFDDGASDIVDVLECDNIWGLKLKGEGGSGFVTYRGHDRDAYITKTKRAKGYGINRGFGKKNYLEFINEADAIEFKNMHSDLINAVPYKRRLS